MAHEVRAGLRNGHSASGWYSSSITKTMALAATKHPEIAKDPNHRMAFTAALAITSQGERVPNNLKLATEAYETFKKTGHFPEKVQAVQGPSMQANFGKLNALIDKMGLDKTREFLSKKMTVGDLRKMGYDAPGENKETEVYGSAILGPKIGNGFYQNLSGNFDPVTFDLWWMRGWGRLTGTLTGGMDQATLDKQEARLRKELGDRAPADKSKLIAMAHAIVKAHEQDFEKNRADFDSGKKVKSQTALAAERYIMGRQGIKEQPASGGERSWMRGVAARAIKILHDDGIDISPADFQATWWYPEKDLYEHMAANTP